MRIRPILTTAYGLLLILLVLGTQGWSQTVLNFPRLTGGVGTITGVAIGNPDGAETANVTLTAYGAGGVLLSGADITNPVQIAIPPGQQFSRVTSEIFGTGLADGLVAWFQATSSTSNLSGFFLFLDAAATVFDGADLPPLEHKIIFNQVRVSNDESTELNIFNPGDVDTGIDLLLLDGEDVIQQDPDNIDFVIEGHGAARINVADFFDVSQVTAGASVLVLSDTEVGGFEFVERAGADLIGLNARPAGEFLNTLYFPQLAVLGPWVMQVGVSNYSNQDVTVVLTAFKPDGSRYDAADLAQNPVTRMLGPGMALREDVEAMFGFAGDQSLEGWIQVDSDSSAVNGYVSYGIPGNGSEAAVAAVARPKRRAVFSHIATDLGFFTGVAVLNPGSSFADLEIIASRADGTVLGSFTTVLAPGERLSRLLSDLIPGAAGQAGGLILVRCNRPLYFTSLFGTESGTVLANIPPQDVPDTYSPATGLPEIQITPDHVVLEAGQSQQFVASGATDTVAWQARGQTGGPSDVGMVDESGNYQAPTDPAGNVLAGVQATQGVRSASATVDVIERGTSLTPGAVFASVYHPTLGQVFLAGQPSAAAGPAGASTQVVRVVGTVLEPVATVPDTVGAMAAVDLRVRLEELVYESRPYLLALGVTNNALYRIDPSNGDVLDILTSSSELSDLAVDPVTGALRLAGTGGIETVSMVLAEADLLGLPGDEPLPPRFAVNAPGGVSSLEVDGCTGDIFFSQSSGGVFRLNGGVQEVVSGLTADRLQILYRRDFGCPDGPRLLTADASGRVAMVRPTEGDALNWLADTDATDFAWVPATASGSGVDQVLIAGNSVNPQGAASEVVPVDVAELFQPGAVNPVSAYPVGTILDPVGDSFGDPAVLQHEVLEMTALTAPGSTELVIEVFFAETVAPCIEPCPNEGTPVEAVVGFIDLDVERTTGLISTIDINSPFTTGMKANYCLDFNVFDPDSGGVALFRTREDAGDRFEFVGRVPVEFEAYSFRVRLPLSLMGNPAPEDIRLAAVMGTPEQPTDVTPNGGALRVQVTNSIVAGDTSAAPRKSSWKGPQILRRVRSSNGKWSRLVPQ